MKLANSTAIGQFHNADIAYFGLKMLMHELIRVALGSLPALVAIAASFLGPVQGLVGALQ